MKALVVPMSNGQQKKTDVFNFAKGELDAHLHLNEAFSEVQTQLENASAANSFDLQEHDKDRQAHADIRALFTEGPGVGESIAAHDVDEAAHGDIRGELEDVKAVAADGMPKAGGAFAGAVVAANTSDGSAQLRNILVADEVPSELETGVVCFVYE